MGIYGCAMLHEAGFSKVFCSDINADRLAMVKKFGGIPLQGGKKTVGSHLVELLLNWFGKKIDSL